MFISTLHLSIKSERINLDSVGKQLKYLQSLVQLCLTCFGNTASRISELTSLITSSGTEVLVFIYEICPNKVEAKVKLLCIICAL